MKNLYSEWEKHAQDNLGKNELNEAYLEVLRTAGLHENTAHRRNSSVSRSAGWAFLAAAILFVAGVSIHTLKREILPEQAALCELTTSNGQIRKVTLPDGTKVTLNAGSTLIYPEKYGKGARSAYLSGEAIFEVTRNGSPFTVKTSDLEINVHGTVFNVNAYPDSRTAETTLCSGSISAKIKATGKEIDMIPFQNLCYNKENATYELSTVDVAEDTSWENGKLCFNAKSVHEIAKTLQRTYNVNVYVTSDKYDKALITAKFIYGESLNDVMKAICRLVPGMKYSIVNNNIYIK